MRVLPAGADEPDRDVRREQPLLAADHIQANLFDIMTAIESKSLLWLAISATLAFLIYWLAPVLTPFLIAALLAYMGNPLVSWMQRGRLSRSWSVVIVFIGLSATALLLLLLFIPVMERQLAVLIARLPGYIDWIQQTALPWLQTHLGAGEGLDLASVKAALKQNLAQAGGVVVTLAQSFSSSGLALLGLFGNLVLVPVVTFYLLRDWQGLVERLQVLLPRHLEPTVVSLARQADEVLGAFLRGQLLVMLALGTIYSVGLWIIGLDYALLIGLVAGVVSFVPYLGLILGLALAVVAALFQFQDVMQLIPVAVVFGVGQILESVVLTPLLVGDRIGLHPVAVIFAVLAFGQLFGFFGVLLALPAAAVLMVVLRYLYSRYVGSSLYDELAEMTPDVEDGG